MQFDLVSSVYLQKDFTSAVTQQLDLDLDSEVVLQKDFESKIDDMG